MATKRIPPTATKKQNAKRPVPIRRVPIPRKKTNTKAKVLAVVDGKKVMEDLERRREESRRLRRERVSPEVLRRWKALRPGVRRKIIDEWLVLHHRNKGTAVIESPVDAIHAAEFRPFVYGRKYEGDVMMVSEVIVVETDDGIYTNAVEPSQYRALGSSHNVVSLLHCLVKLGHITEEQVKQHITAIRAKEAVEERKDHAKGIQELASELNFRLSDAQKKKLRKIADGN